MKSAVLFIVLVIGIGVSIYFSYTHLVVQQDYETFDSEAEIEEESGIFLELEVGGQEEIETEE